MTIVCTPLRRTAITKCNAVEPIIVEKTPRKSIKKSYYFKRYDHFPKTMNSI